MDLFLDNGEYKYKQQPLRPQTMAEIMRHLLDGKRFARREAINLVKQFHLENGGVIDDSKDYAAQFKKVCSKDLKGYGIKNVGYGEWLLDSADAPKIDRVESVITQAKEESLQLVVEKEIGEGNGSIYVYYYTIYRKYAQVRGKKIWECKIGRSGFDPVQRVLGQSVTCYPEVPTIGLIIHCDNPVALEAFFHNALKVKKRWIEDAPGVEWFLTSPEEVEQLYNALMFD